MSTSLTTDVITAVNQCAHIWCVCTLIYLMMLSQLQWPMALNGFMTVN